MLTNNGGKPNKRDTMNYMAPCGPTNIMDGNSPGLHGDNCENSGSQGPEDCYPQTSGSVGLGGDSPRRSGTQGSR